MALEDYFEAIKVFNRGAYCSVDVLENGEVNVKFHKEPSLVLLSSLVKKFLGNLAATKKELTVVVKLCKGEDVMSSYHVSVPYERLDIVDELCENAIIWHNDGVRLLIKEV